MVQDGGARCHVRVTPRREERAAAACAVRWLRASFRGGPSGSLKRPFAEAAAAHPSSDDDERRLFVFLFSNQRKRNIRQSIGCQHLSGFPFGGCIFHEKKNKKERDSFEGKLSFQYFAKCLSCFARITEMLRNNPPACLFGPSPMFQSIASELFEVNYSSFSLPSSDVHITGHTHAQKKNNYSSEPFFSDVTLDS